RLLWRLCGSHNERDRGRESLPVGTLLFEPSSARRRRSIESCTPVGLRDAPLGGDPALTFQSLKRRIERTLVHPQHVLRQILDALRNRPPVQLLGGDGAQNQKIERALNEVRGSRHAYRGYLQENMHVLL